MTWLRARLPVIAGLLVVLGVGQVILGLVDEEAVTRPFERSGSVGEVVEMRHATVQVGNVDGSTILSDGSSGMVTPGVWIVAEVTITMVSEPESMSYAAIRDRQGRIFVAGLGSRNVWTPGRGQPGVPRVVMVAIELPVESAPGAELLLARRRTDHRRDDMAVVDLGITEADAAAWAERDDPEADMLHPELPREAGS